jgi:hypothetical protein
MEVKFHTLNSALYGGECSDSCPDRFTPYKRAPGNVKIKVLLYFIKNYAMKAYGKMEVKFHTLNSALYGGECSDSCPDRFTP